MKAFITAVLVVVALSGSSLVVEAQPGRFTSRCKLAYDLRDHGVANLAAWVCLADVHTNGRFDNLHKQGDGYGLWEISAKNWCRDGLHRSSETSRCNLDCDRFWDTDHTDDIRCFTQMFVEKGFPEFRGWKIRHATCPDLKRYLAPCGLP